MKKVMQRAYACFNADSSIWRERLKKVGVFFTTMHDWFSIGFLMILRIFLRVFIDSHDHDPFQLLSNVRLLLLMKTDLNSLSSFTTVWFALFCCNVLFERLMIWWRSVKIRCYLLNYSLGKFFFFSCEICDATIIMLLYVSHLICSSHFYSTLHSVRDEKKKNRPCLDWISRSKILKI